MLIASYDNGPYLEQLFSESHSPVASSAPKNNWPYLVVGLILLSIGVVLYYRKQLRKEGEQQRTLDEFPNQ